MGAAPESGYRPWWVADRAAPGVFASDPADPLVSPDFAGWWTRSLALIRAGWRPVMMVQLCGLLPFLALGLIGALTWGRGFLRAAPATGAAPTTGASIDVAVLWWVVPAALLGSLWLLVVQLASSQLLIQWATGRPFSISSARRLGVRRVGPLIGWYLAAVPLILIGFVCCVLPGYYVVAVLATLPAVVLIERGRGLGRCFRLFHANVGLALGRVVTTFALTMFLSGIQVGISAALTGFAVLVPGRPGPAAIVVASLVSALCSIGTAVVGPAFLLTTYADLRARYEPFTTRDLLDVR